MVQPRAFGKVLRTVTIAKPSAIRSTVNTVAPPVRRAGRARDTLEGGDLRGQPRLMGQRDIFGRFSQ